MKIYIALALGGIPLGAMYALQALGIVIVFKTSKVFNFASGAIGLVCAYFASSLGPENWFTRILAILAAVLLGTIIGVLMELTVRPVKGALTGTIVTLGWLLALTGFVGLAYGRQAGTHEPVQLAGASGNDNAFKLFDVLEPSWQQLLLFGIAGVLAAGLAAFFRLTDLGTATRAVSEAPDAARLLGIAVDKVNLVAWGLGGAVSGLAGVLVAPLLGPLDNTALIILTVQALAAALVGRLSSLPRTVVGGLVLGMLQPVITYALKPYQGIKGTPELTAFFVVIVALLFFKRSGRKDVVSGGLKPVPIRPLPQGRVAIASFLGIAVAALVVPSLLGDAGRLSNYNVSQVAVWGTATLSLVLLVGVVGQVSVCQAVFMGCGAFGTGIALSHDVPFLLALVVGALLAAAVAALVGLPAIRLEPLELAIATLSLSFTADRFLYSWPPLAGENGRREVPRPGFANVDPGHISDGNRAYAWLLLGIFIAACFAVASLRRGRTGAALTALRSSEPATAAMGFSVTSVKLRGFAASGFLAGLAGAMYGGLIQSVTGAPFDFSRSITLLAYAVIIGVGSVPGAFFGGLLVTLTTLDFGATNGVANGKFVSGTTMVTGLFLIGVLMASPDGIAGAVGRLRREPAPAPEEVLA